MFRGVDGIVVPRIDSPAEAAAVLQAVRYCFTDHHAHKAVVVQIESIAAVQEIDGFLSLEGIDAFFIGPVDLAKSMGAGADYTTPAVAQTIETTIAAIVAAGRAAGTLVEPETIEDVAGRGVTFFYLYANDFFRVGAERLTAMKPVAIRPPSDGKVTPGYRLLPFRSPGRAGIERRSISTSVSTDGRDADPLARRELIVDGGAGEATNSIALVWFGRVASLLSSRSFALTRRFGVSFLSCRPKFL